MTNDAAFAHAICYTVYCRHNPRTVATLTWKMRVLLMFVKKNIHICNDEGLVTVWKRYRGVDYILAQEPISRGWN